MDKMQATNIFSISIVLIQMSNVVGLIKFGTVLQETIHSSMAASLFKYNTLQLH